MDIMRAEYPELAKTSEPETVASPVWTMRQSPARNERLDEDARLRHYYTELNSLGVP